MDCCSFSYEFSDISFFPQFESACEMCDIIPIARFACWLKKEKWSEMVLEGDTLQRRPFAICKEKATEGLSKMLSTLSTWEFEDIFSPLGDCFVCVVYIFDEVGSSS